MNSMKQQGYVNTGTPSIAIGPILFVCLMLILLISIFNQLDKENVRDIKLMKEAISLGYASYNKTNGSWQWIIKSDYQAKPNYHLTLKGQAIQLSYAEYNSTNGNWQWITNNN